MRGRGAFWNILLRGWLFAAAALACAPTLAQRSAPDVAMPAVEIAHLPADAPAHEVVSGRLDARFEVRSDGAPFIYERAGSTRWWRVRANGPVSASLDPQLVLEGPYLAQVEAWVPGQRAPTRHAIFGPHADLRYSTRALFVGLPDGLRQGDAIYLRVSAPAAVPIAVRLASRDEVHREDLVHVAWRTAILTTLAVLALLALGYRFGVGEPAYVYLAATLAAGALYLAGTGGEARGIPLLDALLGQSPQAVRVVGCLGTLASNHFMRLYLELGRRSPALDAALRWLMVAMGLLAAANALVDAPALANAANIVLMLSSVAVLAAALRTSFQGSRAGWFLLVSWTPLIVTCILKALQLSGFIVGAAWFTHALAASFALSGLILTIGLSDKLLQLRRDRDRASRQASIDGLTGLHNRAAIEKALDETVAAAHAGGRPMCVAFVDIDHFKAINDGHGHQVGDTCLKLVALRVRNQLRARDLLGRYGGDEMLVVMPDTTLAEGLQRAERLRETIACRPLSIDGTLVAATLSIGLAALRRDESAAQLLERADAALYRSKASGRDHVTGADLPPQPESAT
jgi:diguanylate cyclase (GGDEF)-like protein